MKFPTYKEMGEKVAKEALDTFEYNGKTLREWIEIIASNDGDTISRKAAIKDAESWVAVDEHEKNLQKNVVEWLKEFPSAEHGTNLAEVGTDVPDTNVGELISRKAVLSLPIYNEKNLYGNIIREYVDIEDVKQLPSAEPKRGKWIHDGSKWKNRWVCSECGYKWFFDCIEGAYCPNCGSDMRGEQDG